MLAMSSELSVSELAVAVAPVVSHPREPSEGDVDVVLRRLRSWTVAGAITAVGSSAHTGSGKHRRYDGDTAFVAAALNVLAENDQGIGVLVNAGRYLRNLSGPNPLFADTSVEHWNEAISGSKEVFFLLGVGARSEAFEERNIIHGLVLRDGLPKGVQSLQGGVFVNLTAAFKLIRL